MAYLARERRKKKQGVVPFALDVTSGPTGPSESDIGRILHPQVTMACCPGQSLLRILNTTFVEDKKFSMDAKSGLRDQ